MCPSRVSSLGPDGPGNEMLPLSSPFTFGAQSTLVILFNFSDLATQPYTPRRRPSPPRSVKPAIFFWRTRSGRRGSKARLSGWFTIAAVEHVVHSQYLGLARRRRRRPTRASTCANYPRRVFGFPQTTACTWWGLGTVGGGSAGNPVARLDQRPLLAAGRGPRDGPQLRSLSLALAHLRLRRMRRRRIRRRPRHHGGRDRPLQRVSKRAAGLAGLRQFAHDSAGIRDGGNISLAPYPTPNGGLPKALKILKSTVGSTNTYIYAEARTAYGADSALAPGVSDPYRRRHGREPGLSP